jgi:TetR/AcrR family transcriptional regulator
MPPSDTEQQLFDAALTHFARHGKTGARMQAIADAAGINKAMLHYYFRSKDALYEAVFAHATRQFMASFDTGLASATSFAEGLRFFIDGYITFCRRHTDAMRLMVNENLRGGSLVGEHLKRLNATAADAPQQLMLQTIEQAIARGEIRPVNPHHTLLSIVSACLFPFMARPTAEVLHPDAGSWDAFLEARKEHLFDLLYHGLCQPTAPS